MCQTVVLSVAEYAHPTVTSQWTPLTVSDVFGSLSSDQTGTKTAERRFALQTQGVVSGFLHFCYKGNHYVLYVML